MHKDFLFPSAFPAQELDLDGECRWWLHLLILTFDGTDTFFVSEISQLMCNRKALGYWRAEKTPHPGETPGVLMHAISAEGAGEGFKRLGILEEGKRWGQVPLVFITMLC